MTWKVTDPQGFESQKIKWELIEYTRGVGLDLGCGPRKAYEHFIGVDSNIDAQLFGIQCKPDIDVVDAAKLPLFATHSMDFVFSSHLLEHIEDYRSALREWWRVVKPDGYLILYLPHKDYYPNVGQPGANIDHKHDFLPDDIIQSMKAMPGGWDLVECQERNNDNEYSFFQVYRKEQRTGHRQSWNRPTPEKTAAVVRYGAFGDMMMASSVIKGLKDEGYHVTLYATPPGSDVIAHDPHIDRIILQGKDQVPNAELGNYWAYIAKKYDKFVNLCESVEGTFLALPGRTQHAWPKNLRHSMMNRNYLEFQHDLAGMPRTPQVRFYATDDEKAWASKQRSKLGEFTVLWGLAGSSVHKVWPHLDTIIARLLLLKHVDVRIVLCGGPECVIIEQGWENEPRVLCTSGKWNIRQSLAFIDQADLVIGPETGVMNAASHRPVAKIVTLSHSSHENLTRDWVNTQALEPKNTPCWPCHQMHYGWEHCHQDKETGTSICQTNIGAEAMWKAVSNVLDNFLRKAA